MKVSNELMNYLRDRFTNDNHPKYHKYFDEWVNGLVDSQIHYFTIDMNKK